MRFTAVQEQPEIPKHETFCEIHREMYCLGCNQARCKWTISGATQQIAP